MKKSVKDFINVTLTGTAWKMDLFDPENESLVIGDEFKHYRGLMEIPDRGSVQIRDRHNGNILGQMFFKGTYKSTDGKKRYVIHSITRGDITRHVQQIDWMEYLEPIVEDFKDGSDHLTSSDVDWLMVVLRAKIDFNQGLISKVEYDMIINDTEN